MVRKRESHLFGPRRLAFNIKKYWTECGNCGNRGIRIVASVGQNEMIATAKLQGGTDVRTVCTDQLGICSLWGNATLGLLPSTIHSLARCFGIGPQLPGFGFQGTSPWAQGISPYGQGGMIPPFAPQTWLGGPAAFGQFGQFNPMAHIAQQIPQLVYQAQQIAQQLPQLVQQIPQLLQQNPQLTQQAPQLQHVPQLLQQAALIAQQVPQLLQALSPQLQGGLGGYRAF